MESVGGAKEAAEAAAVLRKVDWRMLPWVALLYLFCILDRTNISNVKAQMSSCTSGDGLCLSEQQFSQAISIFFIGYILVEIPSNLIIKRVNPAFWIGTIVVAFGVCSTSMAFVASFANLLTVRAFLGVAEGGFFPGIVYILTFWYRREELALRIGLFYVSSSISGVIGGILAYGILSINGSNGLGPFSSWQLLFLFEGAPAVLLGMATWFYLPTYPLSARWLSERERELVHKRVAAQRSLVKAIDRSQLLRTLRSPKIVSFAIMDFAVATPAYAIGFYLPEIIRQAGYSDPVTINLLIAPVYLVSAIGIVVGSWYSDHSGRRFLVVLVPSLLACLGLAVLAVGNFFGSFGWQYFAMFVAAPGGACLIPVILAWMGDTVRGSTRTPVAYAMVVGIGNLSGMVGPTIYSSTYACFFEDRSRGPVGVPCPLPNETACAPYPAQPYTCPWEITYLYGHIVMAAFMFFAALVSILVHFYVTVDPEETAPATDSKAPGGSWSINDDSRLLEDPVATSQRQNATDRTPLLVKN